MHSADLATALGSSNSIADGQRYYSQWDITVLFEGDRATRMGTTSARYRTASGAGVGTTFETAPHLIGDVNPVVTKSGGDTTVIFASKGIGFVFRSGRAVWVLIQEPLGAAGPPPAGAPSVNATTNSYLIVPGKSIGAIKLGMPKELVVKQLGGPERVEPTTLGQEYIYERLSLTVAFEFDNVTGIRTWDSAMRTAEGLGVGSGWPSVAGAFGNPQKSDDYSVYYYTRGILFRYDVYISSTWSVFVDASGRLKEDGRTPVVTHVEVFEPQ